MKRRKSPPFFSFFFLIVEKFFHTIIFEILCGYPKVHCVSMGNPMLTSRFDHIIISCRRMDGEGLVDEFF